MKDIINYLLIYFFNYLFQHKIYDNILHIKYVFFMLFIFFQYIFCIAYYFITHIILLYFIFSVLTERRIIYDNPIQISFPLLTAYKKIFIEKEKSFYISYNTKKIIIYEKKPQIQINNIIFWHHRIGLLNSSYQSQSLCPKIISFIPTYQLNEYIIANIIAIYKKLSQKSKIIPKVFILNKNEIKYIIENKEEIINIKNNNIIKDLKGIKI